MRDYWILKSRHISLLAPKIPGLLPSGYPRVHFANKYAYGPFVEVNRGDVVFDVGAFIGGFTLSIAKKASKVISIEPDPLNYLYLVRNTEHLKNTVTIKTPLWNENVKLPFKLGFEPWDSSIINVDSSHERGSLYVQAKRLDTLFSDLGLDRIDFLKIDVEGAEPEVLQGAEGIKNKIRKVAVDCSPERHGKPTIIEVRNILKKWGFNVHIQRVWAPSYFSSSEPRTDTGTPMVFAWKSPSPHARSFIGLEGKIDSPR